jgi:hypothetical protein
MEGGERSCSECDKGMMSKITTVFLACLVCLLCWATSALAEDKKTPKETTEEITELCPGLDYRLRPSKKFIGEVDLIGGNYLGDLSRNTWAVGGRGYFHINHVFAVGTEYIYSRLSVDPSSDFGRGLKTKNQHILDAQLMINNEALIAAGSYQIPMDFYLTLGFGSIYINDQWEWLSIIGGGVKIYFKPSWVALRIDVNSYLHPAPTATGDKFSGDVSFLIGVAFHFPHRKAESKNTNPKS